MHGEKKGREKRPAAGVRWLKDKLISKRTDHVFRMVMVGDPKVRLDEIGIPSDIAEKLLPSTKIPKK